MTLADVLCLFIALVALGLLAYVAMKQHSEAAAFFGSAARFQDAIENRALKISQRYRLGVDPTSEAEPVLAGQRMPMPEMPDVLKARWKEAAEGSNIPDTWQVPQEV